MFDAGMGDGTVLAHVMRDLHRRFPTVPHLVVGKEISMEDVRLSLEKMADRFAEHPHTVLVVTNMHYSEAPWLRPRVDRPINWHEVSLTGASAHEFENQLRALQPVVDEGWQVEVSAEMPAADYLVGLDEIDGLREAAERLAGGHSPGGLAAALEFILEGLHLANRLNKDVSAKGVRFGGA